MMKAVINNMTRRVAFVLCLMAHLSVFAIHEEVEGINTGLSLTSPINVESSRKIEIDGDVMGWFNDFRFASISNEIIFGINQEIYQVDDLSLIHI